jgi:hypothetical protein
MSSTNQATFEFSDELRFDELVRTLAKLYPNQIGFLMPNTVMRYVQCEIFGTCPFVNRDSISDEVLDRLLEATKRIEQAVPSLNEEFELILQDLKLNEPFHARAALRDLGEPFLEVAKMKLNEMRKRLCAIGICEEDALEMSLAIYRIHRRELANTVSQSTKLESALKSLENRDVSVDISNCQIDSSNCRQVFEKIQLNSALRVLDLSGNNIHKDGAREVAQMIASLPLLEDLNLSGNNLLLTGANLIINSLQTKENFKRLNLSCCHTTNAVISSLAKLPKLLELSLAGNDLHPLTDFPEMPNLKRLDLCSNSLMTSDSVKVSALVQRMVKVRVLNLSNNFFDDDCVDLLATAIETCPSISLALNPISDDGAVRILSLWKAAIDVDLSDTKVSLGTRKSVENMCRDNHFIHDQQLKMLRSKPLKKWSAQEVQIVLEHCVNDSLFNFSGDGEALASLHDASALSVHDWNRFMTFQVK